MVDTRSSWREFPWRVGRKVGRTIYAQVEAAPSDEDVLIGTMDTPDLAMHVVAAHNRGFR